MGEFLWEMGTFLVLRTKSSRLGSSMPNYRWNGGAASFVLFSTTALARRSPQR